MNRRLDSWADLSRPAQEKIKRREDAVVMFLIGFMAGWTAVMAYCGHFSHLL